MADKKISELNAVTASNIDGTEVLPIVDSSETKKITALELQRYIVNHLEPTSVTVSVAGGTIDLDASTYDEAIELTLPDATATKNLNRVIRIISDSTFTTSTHADLTPVSGQNLDGSSSAYRINRAYEGIMVWCNGTEWFVVQQKA